VKQTPKKAGVIIFGLPYQLIDFHRRTSDLRNVQTVLRPVKPSDFLRAAWKLASVNALGEPDWMQESLPGSSTAGGGEDDGVVERLRAAAANADHNAGRAGAGADAGASPARVRAPPRDEGDGHAACATATTSAEEKQELSGMRVLLVEDNVMNQQMAKFSIIRSGAELEIAQHGKEAVDMVSSRLEQKLPNYDCVLMDMMMPVMDGATATVLIRELEKKHGAETPHAIVGLSANVGPEYTDKVKKAGMNGSLSKPFYPATLRNVLEQVYKGTYVGFSGKGGKDAATSDIQSKPGN
jgi:CheY-like chemotaxis protein